LSINQRGYKMTISYMKLWHRLLDKNMTKTELQKEAGLSWASIAKLNRGGNVNTSVLLRICKVLDCDFSDIMEIVRDKAVDGKAIGVPSDQGEQKA